MSKETDTLSTPIKDSGKRSSFETGAVRDISEGKGRMDLLPVDAIEQVAKHFEKGAQKYEPRNWEKGIPLSRYLDSALRHTFKTLRGDTDEPHPVAGAWNLLCFIQTLIWIEKGLLPASLNDLPRRVADDRDEECRDEETANPKTGYETAADSVARWFQFRDGTPLPSFEKVQDQDIQNQEIQNQAAARASVISGGEAEAPRLIRRFRPKNRLLNPNLDCVEFVNGVGFFVYTSGSRLSHRFPLSHYLNHGGFVEIK